MVGVEDGLERRSRARVSFRPGMIFFFVHTRKETEASWQRSGLALAWHSRVTTKILPYTGFQ